MESKLAEELLRHELADTTERMTNSVRSDLEDARLAIAADMSDLQQVLKSDLEDATKAVAADMADARSEILEARRAALAQAEALEQQVGFCGVLCWLSGVTRIVRASSSWRTLEE